TTTAPSTTTTVTTIPYTGSSTTTTLYTGSSTSSTSTTTTTTTPSTTTTAFTGPTTTITPYTGQSTTSTSTASTTTIPPSTTTGSTTLYTGPSTTSTTTTTPSTTTVSTTRYTGPPTTTTTGPTTTTTQYTGSPTTTNVSTTTTGEEYGLIELKTSSGCVDLNANGICDVYEEMRCETVLLQGKNYLIARIITYIATGWVVFWCLLTILINICHKNSGHHRGIHLWEELGIIVLWVFMGVLNLTFRNKNLFCKIISIVIHYFIVFIAACFVFEAIFANSMVHNKKRKNGCIPAFFNYLFPIAIAALPCLLTYFLNKNDYGSNGMHCFVITELEIVYAFIIPVWVLLSIATLYSSLGNLACDLTHSDQDQPQCYWAKKSCKVLPLLSYWIFLAYLTCMFGSSSQRLWVLILFVIQSLFLGPMIFVSHTFGHRNTALKWYSPSLPGKFYRGCSAPALHPLSPVPPIPIKSSPPPRTPRTPRVRETSPTRSQPEPTSNVVKRSPPKEAPSDDHMYANELWGWATSKNGDDVHFRPKPVSYDF
ncbi:hypothetical protein PMAYCL1PPCAC_17513, partial [Pristionchus mayeri]